MRFTKFLGLITAIVCMTSSAAFAAQYSSHDEMNERDFEAVLNFIKCKRQVPLAEKMNDLMISGDIRMEWENIHEKDAGIRRRGRGAEQNVQWFHGERIADNQFDVEFNLMLDYKGPCTWAVAHIEFDNNAGIDENHRGCVGAPVYGDDGTGNYTLTNSAGDPYGSHGSGSCHNVCLRKAYFGWNIFEECNCRLDIEIGRRNLHDVFDSRVQFRSRFDGVLFRYSNCFECVADFYVNLGFFVIDERVDHWGWAIEVGILDIADYGIDFKYSFIDWSRDGLNRCSVKDPIGMQFLTSQLYLAYNFDAEIICTKAKIYGAFLFNHDADKRADFNHKRKNYGWYAGFMVGEVCQEGDWHIDVNYQDVEAAVIPDSDVSGIGRGNVRNIPNTVNVGEGNTNYKGWRFEGLYAITDNLSVNPSYEYSREEDTRIGNKHRFSKWELQFIYAF